MPSLLVTVDSALMKPDGAEPLRADYGRIAMIAHEAITSALKKPGQYITVSVMKAEVVLVGGQEKGVWAQLDSIGGAEYFDAFARSFTKRLDDDGIDPAKVTCTFRNVGRGEFAMNGKTFA